MSEAVGRVRHTAAVAAAAAVAVAAAGVAVHTHNDQKRRGLKIGTRVTYLCEEGL